MSRRNLRQVPRIDYYEPEEPSWDEYIYCDECYDYVYEYCSIHGDLLVVPDDKVPAKTNFPSYVPRAALTIPHVFLHLAPSIIPGAGLGVFATLTLPRGVRFGPYRGLRTQAVDSMYGWQIYDRHYKPSHVVDAAAADRANWMRYVNCARHWCEQNLVAYQYQGQLYYRTIKIIPRFTELMVFYGGEFACRLGVDLARYNSPLPRLRTSGATVTKKPKTEINKSNNDLKNENTIEEGKSDATKPKFKKPVSNDKINKRKNCDLNNNSEIVSIDNVINEIDKSKDFNSNDKLKKKQNIIKNSNLSNNGVINNIVKDSHLKICAGIKKHVCDICNKSFSLKHHLTHHIRIHTGERPYNCDICEKRFTQKSNLIKHTRIHAGEKPFTCNHCNKGFTYASDLKIHIRIHTGEKPYTCDICEKRFSQKTELVIHTSIHTGVKPFTCNHCNKGFTYASYLKRHIRIHTGEKPYKCDICEKRFTQKGSLTKHTRIHAGEKPFTCNHCNKGFSDLSYLKIHIRIHTGERPYTCDICDMKFSQPSTVKAHLKVHM